MIYILQQFDGCDPNGPEFRTEKKADAMRKRKFKLTFSEAKKKYSPKYLDSNGLGRSVIYTYTSEKKMKANKPVRTETYF